MNRIWFSRILLLWLISLMAMTVYLYAMEPNWVKLGLLIFCTTVTIVSVYLHGETRYNQGRIDRMQWLKRLWGK